MNTNLKSVSKTKGKAVSYHYSDKGYSSYSKSDDGKIYATLAYWDCRKMAEFVNEDTFSSYMINYLTNNICADVPNQIQFW